MTNNEFNETVENLEAGIADDEAVLYRDAAMTAATLLEEYNQARRASMACAAAALDTQMGGTAVLPIGHEDAHILAVRAELALQDRIVTLIARGLA